MNGGTPLHRPTALGSEERLKQSPTYERVVRWLAGHFGVEPIRSLVNFYRNGEDYTSFHSDQYFSGVNMTIGASFGEERSLLFEHRESKEQFSFPQHNGDVFAFTDEVNRQFMHAIPRERRARSTSACRHTPGRISVILWARKDQESWKKHAQMLPINLLSFPHVLEYDPNKPQPQPAVETAAEAAAETTVATAGETNSATTAAASIATSTTRATITVPTATSSTAEASAATPELPASTAGAVATKTETATKTTVMSATAAIFVPLASRAATTATAPQAPTGTPSNTTATAATSTATAATAATAIITATTAATAAATITSTPAIPPPPSTATPAHAAQPGGRSRWSRNQSSAG
ncbi:unnamed protein product [Polarella glacialis]|uniref:Alpha-ketoglutarate-dependent dioxygenase AlkB-like domain-containing protein n=1 Tax=Polarella glacialis TaxID=89957 RepID=A0A813FS58_POLGL|nr:unnamed protein product [Polarella glacialis]